MNVWENEHVFCSYWWVSGHWHLLPIIALRQAKWPGIAMLVPKVIEVGSGSNSLSTFELLFQWKLCEKYWFNLQKIQRLTLIYTLFLLFWMCPPLIGFHIIINLPPLFFTFFFIKIKMFESFKQCFQSFTPFKQRRIYIFTSQIDHFARPDTTKWYLIIFFGKN